MKITLYDYKDAVKEIDSGPRGDDARGDINLAILVLEKEKESLWFLKKFLEMRGD